jgi:hypothetical protein
VSTFVTSGSGGLDGPIDFGFHPASQALVNVPSLSEVGLSVLIAALVLAGSRSARRGAYSRKGSA